MQSFSLIRTSNIIEDWLIKLLLTSPHEVIAAFRLQVRHCCHLFSFAAAEMALSQQVVGSECRSCHAQPDIRMQGKGSLCATPALSEHSFNKLSKFSTMSKYQLSTSIKMKATFLAVSVFHCFHHALQACVKPHKHLLAPS